MSFTRTGSLRKPVRPVIDIDEDDDDRRRDAFGRKRVDVVQCLLDSSSDTSDNEVVSVNQTSTILWLTWKEMSHIRAVLTRMTLIADKQCADICDGRICFRCRKEMNGFFFLPSFLRCLTRDTCSICQQMICRRCSCSTFPLPSTQLPIPVRIQTLLKPSSLTVVEKRKPHTNQSNASAKTVCYDCLQLFNDHTQTSQHHLRPVTSAFRRTWSLPPMSTQTSSLVRHRRRPLEKKTRPNTSLQSSN